MFLIFFKPPRLPKCNALERIMLWKRTLKFLAILTTQTIAATIFLWFKYLQIRTVEILLGLDNLVGSIRSLYSASLLIHLLTKRDKKEKHSICYKMLCSIHCKSVMIRGMRQYFWNYLILRNITATNMVPAEFRKQSCSSFSKFSLVVINFSSESKSVTTVL